MNEIKIYSLACIIGGLLRVIGSFISYDSAAESIEILYIATDICLILGLIGFYSVHRQRLFWLGHLGFAIAICGLSFIAGPETELFGMSVYQLGSPIVGAGLLLLSLNLIKAKLCGLAAPMLLAASVVVGLISILVGSSVLFVVTGILFGVGFMALGTHIWRAS
ncbi:MAG: hypothetical protein ACJAQS_001544 [Porticoccus sp.]